MENRHGSVCYSVRVAFSRISTMTQLALTQANMAERSMAISHQTRWHEYGRPATPVKAGLRPSPSATNGLDRVCCPALASHQAFHGEPRLMQEPTTLQPSQKPLTQN